MTTMSGNKKRALGGKTTTSSMSVVEKLRILRNLNCGFSESDLSNCLRQSGYRVDLAAERLVTGQYQPLKKRKNNDRTVDAGAKTTIFKGAVSCSNHVKTTPRQDSIRQTHRRSLMSSSSRPSDIVYSRNHSVAPSTITTPLAPKSTNLTSRVDVSSSSSTLVTPKAMTPGTKRSEDLKIKIESEDWLLCNRWVGDGVNLRRNGACDYQEEFHVLVEPLSSPAASSSSNASRTLRFRSESHRMDGSLPRHLTCLGPLLKNQLIRLKATALMEERGLPIGAQVALSLSVWIVDVVRFFSIFDGNNNGRSHTYTKQYFTTAATSADARSVRRRGQNSGSSGSASDSSLEACRDAAFMVLQWAHFGKPVSSSQPWTSTDNHLNDSNENDSDEAAESNTDKEEADIDADTSAIHTSAIGEDAAIPHWARDFLSGVVSDNNGASVVDKDEKEMEMDAPLGFREGIQLRPYQKRSLYWMTEREKVSGSGKNQYIQLLQELACTSSTSKNLGRKDQEVRVLGSQKEISCDCGPVVVDTNRLHAPSVAKAIAISNLVQDYAVTDEQELDHPLWERRFLCNKQQTKALSFFVQPSFRNAAAEPPQSPLPCRGGILADSMGLGKTVQLLALVQSDVNQDDNQEKKPDTSTLVVAPLSLLHQWQEEIENKTSLSCEVHYNDGNKTRSANSNYDFVDIVLTTYGTLQAEFRSQRDDRSNKMIAVKSKTPLLSRNWKRVILDECHTIKNHSTMVAKACCRLHAERRWAVSGTIIQNSLEDVYSIMRFLRHEPFCEHAFWSRSITKAPDFSVALNRVKRILSPIMMRRTKETRDRNGKLILTLPDIDCKSVIVKFSPEERQFYEALYRKSFSIFKGLIKSGTASSSWLKIFSLLHRLRQACSHVALTVKSHLDDGQWASNITQSSFETVNGDHTSIRKPGNDNELIDQAFLEDLLQKFKCMQNGGPKLKSSEEETDEYALSVANMLNQAIKSDSSELNEECPICLENISMNNSAITPCLHIFCKNCLLLKNDTQSSRIRNSRPVSPLQFKCCPVCSKEIDSRKILQMSQCSSGKIQTSFLHHGLQGEAKENSSFSEEDGNARKTLQTAMKGTNSSKLAAILEELQILWEKEPGSKVLIFSQFLGFLDIIEKSFESNSVPHFRLDGKLNQKRRMEILREFGSEVPRSISHNPKIGSVLLISMKAGGVGLNLVAARSVFIVDPWWNAAVEDQCIDRIHRIGQSAKKIYVRKFFVEDTIEERILELQKRKKGIARAALCDEGATRTDGMGARPSIEDFKILFRGVRSTI